MQQQHANSTTTESSHPFQNDKLDKLFSRMESIVQAHADERLSIRAVNHIEHQGLPYSMIVFQKEYDNTVYYEVILLAASNVGQLAEPSSQETLNARMPFYRATIEFTVEQGLHGKHGKAAKIKILPVSYDIEAEKNVSLLVYQAIIDVEQAIKEREKDPK